MMLFRTQNSFSVSVLNFQTEELLQVDVGSVLGGEKGLEEISYHLQTSLLLL